jgi:hypothetical protein
VRIEGWESRLDAILEAQRQVPYQLGREDCFRLACRAVEAVTGVDRWPEFAGRYRTKREALAEIARFGSSFDRAMDWFFGAMSISVLQARRGDIVSLRDPGGDLHLGVCVGARAACYGPSGLTFVPLSACRSAWRVG